MGEQVISWLIILAGTVCSDVLYTNEPPVKLLSVGFLANRFPSPDSKYRTSISQGEDVPADLGPLEEANGMPNQFLILMPGGCASYELPAQTDEDRNKLYLMVQPGKKQGKYSFDYKDKADISLKATFADMPSEIVCSVKSTDGSPQPSDYCMLNISSLVDNTERILGVELCVPAAESRTASLWELWVSPEDDSRRAKGTFEEEGRQRLRLTQEIEDFNKNLTMASVVGKTGVGKSTVASFLAGNMSMFTSAAAAEGTTTIGTDMSPIIPSDMYIKVLNEKLQEGNIPFNPDLYEPNGIRPLIIMDSEGMSFRGDEFDFITSGPAAIIAKTIVWITTDRIQPSDVLEDIRDYLKGLDRISMGDENVDDTPSYGEFVIVLNKMQSEDQSDDELLIDLMGYPGDDEELETIEKLQQKFESVSVVGLPFVYVDEGEEFGYAVLPERFREGLSKLANHLLQGSETPRIVNVGNRQYEMSSTEAIPIVAMLTDAANSGNIDLSDPCNVWYSIIEERVSEGIISVNRDIESHLDVSCSQTKSGIQCSECACKYRNYLVELTTEMLLGVVANGVEDANLMCEDVSISNRIATLEKTVNNWNENNHCDGTIKMMYADATAEVCDCEWN